MMKLFIMPLGIFHLSIKCNKFVRMGCFADDTTFWTKPSIEQYIKYKLLQRELNRFVDWSKYWRMSINPSKCSYVTIHKSNTTPTNHKYVIENTTLKQVPHCRYLGPWIDSNLSLKVHLKKV